MKEWLWRVAAGHLRRQQKALIQQKNFERFQHCWASYRTADGGRLRGRTLRDGKHSPTDSRRKLAAIIKRFVIKGVLLISPRLQKSVRTVAVFEAVKGALVLIAGFGLLRLLHKDIHSIAYEFILRMDLNPAHKYPRIFIDLASNLTDHKLWFFAGLALVYSLFRFIEGYGLWNERGWAEWFAVISGTLYLPIELYEISVKITFVRIFALAANIAVIGLVAFVLLQKRKVREEVYADRVD
jgi:uncharacterized membrane protein (DUF2068 family)